MKEQHRNSGKSKDYPLVYSEPPHLFSEETIKSLGDLGDVLRAIHKRLIAEGYVISEGKIIKKIDTIEY